MFRPALIALACPSGPAPAQDIDCASAVAQRDLKIRAEQDWQQADAGLNFACKEVMAKMAAMDTSLPAKLQGAATALRAAQRAWIAFRDANCTVAGFPMRGGSAEPLLVYGCPRQMTVERTEALRVLVAY